MSSASTRRDDPSRHGRVRTIGVALQIRNRRHQLLQEVEPVLRLDAHFAVKQIPKAEENENWDESDERLVFTARPK